MRDGEETAYIRPLGMMPFLLAMLCYTVHKVL